MRGKGLRHEAGCTTRGCGTSAAGPGTPATAAVAGAADANSAAEKAAARNERTTRATPARAPYPRSPSDALNVIAAALLATALAGGSDADVIARLHVRIDARDLAVSSCRDVVDSPEAGLATMGFRYQIADAHRLENGAYAGTVVFGLGEIVVSVPKSIEWPDMTDNDRVRADALRRAIVHHEIGHVRIAEAVRDALNTRTPILEPDVFAFRARADAIGRAGFERFTREEHDYDAFTDHGRRQHEAPAPLAGPDTMLRCSE